jgi:hypothetical protein
MSLETATYIDALVVSNPDGADARSTADDHLRLIKASLRRSFPMVAGAVSASSVALSYVNDLSASAQAQLNALRDGSATARAAVTATTAVSASSAAALGGVAASSYVRLDGPVNTLLGQYDVRYATDARDYYINPSAPTGNRAWLVNYVDSNGYIQFATVGNSLTYGVSALQLTSTAGVPQNAFFTLVGTIYVNGQAVTDPLQMNGVPAASYARLDTAQTFQKGVGSTPVAVTDAATISINCESGNMHRIVLGGNRTIAAPSNARPGQVITIHLIQDATGSRTVTWNSIFKFPGGTAPTLSTAASARDVFAFQYDNTSGVWAAAGLNVS